MTKNQLKLRMHQVYEFFRFSIPWRVSDWYRLWFDFVDQIRLFFNGWNQRSQWDFGFQAVDTLYPRFKAFYRYAKKDGHGYPTEFNSPEEWLEILKKVEFGLAYWYYEDKGQDEQHKFFERRNLLSPYRKTKDNERESPIPMGDEPFYYDVALVRQYSEQAQEGLELLGKYLMNMWD